MAASQLSPDARGVIHVVREDDSIATLELEGEFDLSDTDQLIDHANRVLGTGSHLIIDLTDTTFIDSAVVHALFNTDQAAKDRKLMLVLRIATTPGVERVLTITGISKQLTTTRTRQQAIAMIANRHEHPDPAQASYTPPATQYQSAAQQPTDPERLPHPTPRFRITRSGRT